MFPRMFECADKFISFTPYLFEAFTIFLNCDGSLHLGLPLLWWFGTVLGRTKCVIFFYQNLFFLVQAFGK